MITLANSLLLHGRLDEGYDCRKGNSRDIFRVNEKIFKEFKQNFIVH